MTAIELSHDEATTLLITLKRSFLHTEEHRDSCQAYAANPGLNDVIPPATWAEWADGANVQLARIEGIVAKLPAYFHPVWEREIAEARADRKASAA